MSLSLLNSCYFNSAGHIVHAVSYNAAVDTGELNKESGCVYSDRKNAYVELTRYRFEDCSPCRRYEAECRRLKQHGYCGDDALRRALPDIVNKTAAQNPCDSFQDKP